MRPSEPVDDPNDAVTPPEQADEPEREAEAEEPQEAQSEKKSKGPSPAQQLIEIALKEYRLVRSEDARTYAIPHSGGVALPLRSKKGLRAALANSLYNRTGIVATGGVLGDCLTILEGAAADLPTEPVFLRMASHEGRIVVDIGSPAGRAIVITPDGWSVEGASPVIFRRSDLSLRFVEPQPGGSLEKLRALVNLSESDFRLAVGWVVAGYFEAIPHPILFIQGEQGTAKSSLMRLLMTLIDPQPAAERSLPTDKRQWGIFGRASWSLGFDNVTVIPDEMSNALAKGATGEAVFQRELHSDEDIIIFAFRRVLAINTIALKHEMANDLADRILMLEPEVITERLSEEELARRRAEAMPPAFGAVLDLVSGVLKHLPHVTVPNPPRMADFTRILAALDQVTGWNTLKDYMAKVKQVGMTQIEGDTLALALYYLADRSEARPRPHRLRGQLQRTARRAHRDLQRPQPRGQRPARRVSRARQEGPRDRPPAQGRHRRARTTPHRRQAPNPASRRSRASRKPSPQGSSPPLKRKKRDLLSLPSPRPGTAGQRHDSTLSTAVTCRHLPSPPARLPSQRAALVTALLSQHQARSKPRNRPE